MPQLFVAHRGGAEAVAFGLRLGGEEGQFPLHAARRGRVVQGRKQAHHARVTAAAIHAERALPGRGGAGRQRQHHEARACQQRGDAGMAVTIAPQARQSGQRQHDAVQRSVSRARQPDARQPLLDRSAQRGKVHDRLGVGDPGQRLAQPVAG